jgi:class 3 adenylate cyclase
MSDTTNGKGANAEAGLTRKILLANMRHELRTPLNAVIGYSELLMEEADGPVPESFAADLAEINAAGKEILRQVNAILAPPVSETGRRGMSWPALEARLAFAVESPLNRISRLAGMLAEKAEFAERKDVVRDIQKIKSEAGRFRGLIGEIARYPEMEAQLSRGAAAPAGASDLVRDLASSIQPASEPPAALSGPVPASVLVIDDSELNRDLLARHLEYQGYRAAAAENGRRALELLESRAFDLILLDIIMPEMTGFQLLERLKAEEAWRDIPVIMISSLEEIDSVARSLEIGADDYLTKPFNSVLLNARIRSSLEKKRLRDLEKEQTRILEETFGRYVAQEVRDEVLSGRIPLDGELKDVSVLFADLRDFTPLTESTPPKDVVRILNSYFAEMAPAISRHHGSLLRVVGDEVFAVFGAPLALKDHPRHAVETALEMRRLLIRVNEGLEKRGYAPLEHGVGIHSGPVVAANIGSPDRMVYDLVGDTVNLASRIQELTKAFSADIIISSATRAALGGAVAVEKLPTASVKGIKEPVEIFRVL